MFDFCVFRTRWICIITFLLLIVSGCAGDQTSRTYNLTIEIDGQGTVTPSEGLHRFDERTHVRITARPASDWTFLCWDGWVEDEHESETIVMMNGNRTVTAIFRYKLHQAIFEGQYDELKRLLDAGLDVNKKSAHEWTPLHIAAYAGESAPKMCKILLEHGADINSRGQSGWTPLHLAAYHNRSNIAKYLIKQGANKSLAIETFIDLLNHLYEWERDKAIEALAIIGPGAVPVLAEGLDDSRENVRNNVVKVLIKIGFEKASPVLTEIIRDDNLDNRDNAVRALSVYESDKSIEFMHEFLYDEDPDVRKYISQTLVAQGEDITPELLRALQNGELKMRCYAAELLGIIKAEEAITLLIELLDDEEAKMRRYAIEALGRIESSEAVPKLMGLLNDKDVETRVYAVQALGRIGTPYTVVVPALIEATNDEDALVADSAQKALVPALIKGTYEDDVCVSAISMLGEMGSSAIDSTNRLVELLRSNDYNVREAAVKALGEIAMLNYSLLGDERSIVIESLLRTLFFDRKDLATAAAQALTTSVLFLDEDTQIIWFPTNETIHGDGFWITYENTLDLSSGYIGVFYTGSEYDASKILFLSELRADLDELDEELSSVYRLPVRSIVRGASGSVTRTFYDTRDLPYNPDKITLWKEEKTTIEYEDVLIYTIPYMDEVFNIKGK